MNRQDIFTDAKYYYAFMERLCDLLTDIKTSCHAWALVPNHFNPDFAVEIVERIEKPNRNVKLERF